MAEEGVRSTRVARKCAEVARIIVKQEIRARVKQVSRILKKPENVRTQDDERILEESPEIVESAKKRANHRELNKQRLLEVEDEEQVLEEKCRRVAEAIRKSKHLVIYTGAGISTAASIPDYRGPNGIWTLLGKGIQPKAQDLSDAEPTFTHMAISTLYREGKVEHLVSQNCDGLHIRSGYPKERLSELHGNMYLEWCRSCNPPRRYYRLFDVTERTALRRHATGRHCHACDSELRDTIIHFGEKGPLCAPYQWQEAVDAVEKADMILCLGSSLKVLRKYQCLWSLHVPASKRPKLYIVNLQWTPKDDAAICKINGKCDTVLRKVMKYLGLHVSEYERFSDPLYHLATPLNKDEEDSTSKRMLLVPEDLQPFRDCLHPRHRRKTRKRKTNSVPTRCQSKRTQSRKATIMYENTEYLNYDSDTLDAPETLEILEMEKKHCHSEISIDNHTSRIASTMESITLEHTNDSCKTGQVYQKTEEATSDIHQSVPSAQLYYQASSLDSNTQVKKEPGDKFATMKSLLAQSNGGQFVNINQALSRSSLCHSEVTNTRTCSATTSSATVPSCHSVVSQVVSPHQVPNNSAPNNAFHSYCLRSPTSSTDYRTNAYTSIKPALSHNSYGKPGANDPFLNGSQTNIPLPGSGCHGGIMQSLQVYKSLEDHDYCSFNVRKKDLKSDLEANSQEVNSTAHTSLGMHVPITKPSTQKTVAELLREREESRAQTSTVSSSQSQPLKMICNSVNAQRNEAPRSGPIRVESVRLPNPNIKIQGNILLRQFIPNNQRPVVYATTTLVDTAKLRQPAPLQVVPQVFQGGSVPYRGDTTCPKEQTITEACVVTSRSPTLVSSQSEHQMHLADLTSLYKNNQVELPVGIATAGTGCVSVPNLLSPPFMSLMPRCRPAVPEQSVKQHFGPIVFKPMGVQSAGANVYIPANSGHFDQKRQELLRVACLDVSSQTQCLTNKVSAKNEEGKELRDTCTSNKPKELDHITSLDASENQQTFATENLAGTPMPSIDSSSITEQEQNSPPKSAPGWFGKGFNCRRGRRKRGRLT